MNPGSCSLQTFCRRPSAKDLGITRVVAVLFHLSHFLFKRNRSEKNLSLIGTQIRGFWHPSQALYQLSNSNIVTLTLESYLFNFKNHTTDLAPALALVYDNTIPKMGLVPAQSEKEWSKYNLSCTYLISLISPAWVQNPRI